MKVTQVVLEPKNPNSQCVIRIAIPYVALASVNQRVSQRMGHVQDWTMIKVYQKGNNIVVDVPQILAHREPFGGLLVSLAVLERTS